MPLFFSKLESGVRKSGGNAKNESDSGRLMSIDRLQKGSIAILAWVILYFSTRGIVYEIVWPHERRIAAMRAGHYAVDVPPPLPAGAHISIYSAPTLVIG